MGRREIESRLGNSAFLNGRRKSTGGLSIASRSPRIADLTGRHTNETKPKTNQLDLGVVDTLGLISAILSTTFYNELEAHLDVPRSTTGSAPSGANWKTHIIQTERGAAIWADFRHHYGPWLSFDTQDEPVRSRPHCSSVGRSVRRQSSDKRCLWSCSTPLGGLARQHLGAQEEAVFAARMNSA